MKVAVVHYHLQPGGVTRVIENTLNSFNQKYNSTKFVVLSGRQYPGNQIQNVKIVDGLDYSLPKQAILPKTLREQMESAATEALGGKPDIWHIHNHSLGKNPSLTKVVDLLAQDSIPLLLHPHDFAEDGRPSNFQAIKEIYSTAYPSSPLVHYAVLNHRDYSFMQKLLEGKESQVHLLANAIPHPLRDQGKEENKSGLPDNLFLYPVRAVRRKNLGELALISAVHNDKFFANSLGPTNPTFTPIFEEWKQFVKNRNLPVSYALGEQTTCTFHDLVNHAEGIISTSIAEGFGLGFLEPWTFNKFLCGRDIPEITQDFSDLGIQLNHLYNRLDVDIKHLRSEEFLKPKITTSLEKFFSDYGKELPRNSTDIAYHSIVKNGRLDFGRIDESSQMEIIDSVLKSPNAQRNLQMQINTEKPNENIISRNQKNVSKYFSQDTYTDKLQFIYNSILESGKGTLEFASGHNLLESFLTPDRLNLLRTS